jgi:hypothetical protein
MLTLLLVGIVVFPPYEGGASINGASLGASAAVVSITAGLANFSGMRRTEPFCLRANCELK